MKRTAMLSVIAVLFSFALLIESASSKAEPQPQQKPDVNKMLKGGFAEVNGWVIKAADMVPAEKYNYKPAGDVRTFGQLVAHIADSYNYFCAGGAGKKVEWSEAVEKGTTDKATLAPKLKQAVDSCNAVYDSPTEVFPLFQNLAHTNLHYGNIITYMRMMGMKPPSS
jgi:uncharacterized damage-inducible protein DinB